MPEYGEAQISNFKSRVEFPQSAELLWRAMSFADVAPLSFIKTTVNAAVYQDILEHLMVLATDKIF